MKHQIDVKHDPDHNPDYDSSSADMKSFIAALNTDFSFFC